MTLRQDKPRPRFRLIRRGQFYAIRSDSPAASETGGIAIDGLDLAGARKVVTRLREKGSRVDCEKGIDA